jgi:hypothetical protein
MLLEIAILVAVGLFSYFVLANGADKIVFGRTMKQAPDNGPDLLRDVARPVTITLATMGVGAVVLAFLFVSLTLVVLSFVWFFALILHASFRNQSLRGRCVPMVISILITTALIVSCYYFFPVYRTISL